VATGPVLSAIATDRAAHLEAARTAGVGAAGLRGGGVDYCRSLSDVTDGWVRLVFEQAIDKNPELKGRLVILAVGGYGRRELAPYSDLDVLLVHDVKGKKSLAESNRLRVRSGIPCGTPASNSGMRCAASRRP